MARTTHYDTLGVERTAETAAIRARYLALARELHPDRRQALSADGRRAADQRMREVNAAWTVLRHDDRRAAYDRQLREAERPAVSRASDAVARERPSHPRPVVEDSLDDLEVTPMVGWLLRFGPIVALVGTVIGLIIVTAVAQDDTDPDQPPTTTEAPDTFVVGDCFALATGAIIPTDCTDPDAAVLLVTISEPGGPCRITATPVLVDDETLQLCLAPLP